MGRECNTHGRENYCMWDFIWKAIRKETTRKILGRRILNWILEKYGVV
jgi:hypothetical protein